MEAAIVEKRVIVVPETSATCVPTVIKCCTVAGAAIGANEVEVRGARPRMEWVVKTGKLDWVLDTLASL